MIWFHTYLAFAIFFLAVFFRVWYRKRAQGETRVHWLVVAITALLWPLTLLFAIQMAVLESWRTAEYRGAIFSKSGKCNWTRTEIAAQAFIEQYAPRLGATERCALVSMLDAQYRQGLEDGKELAKEAVA